MDTLLDDILGTEEVKYEKSKSPIFSESKNNFQSKGGKCLQTFLSNEEKICMKTFAFKGQTICDKLRYFHFVQ